MAHEGEKICGKWKNSWIEYWLRNKGTSIWKFCIQTKNLHQYPRRKYQISALKSGYYNKLLSLLDGKIHHLSSEIEGRWAKVETPLFGEDYHYKKDEFGNVIVTRLEVQNISKMLKPRMKRPSYSKSMEQSKLKISNNLE